MQSRAVWARLDPDDLDVKPLRESTGSRRSSRMDMIFIAGAGGGTGAGSSPIVAHHVEIGTLTVGIVAGPFRFEARRRDRAKAGSTRSPTRGRPRGSFVPNDGLLSDLDRNAWIVRGSGRRRRARSRRDGSRDFMINIVFADVQPDHLQSRRCPGWSIGAGQRRRDQYRREGVGHSPTARRPGRPSILCSITDDHNLSLVGGRRGGQADDRGLTLTPTSSLRRAMSR